MRPIVLLFPFLPSIALADAPLPPDLAPYKSQLPRVVLKAGQDISLEYLDDSQRYDVAAMGFPVFSIESERWKTLCDAPCNERAVRSGTYRISGDGVITSDVFTLPKKGDRILLDVKAGSVAVRRAAWATFLIGAPTATIGIFATIGTLLGAGGNTQDPAFLGSLTGLGFSLSLVITSIPLFVGSRTVVTADVR